MLAASSSLIWMPPAACLNLFHCQDAAALFVIYADSSFISKA